MEATYCVGNDVDVCRMFDQYLYKRTENLDLSLSIPHPYHSNGYDMNDQTFHTPSFGDEEFDIPAINPQQHGVPSDQQNMQGYQPQQMTMQQMSAAQDGGMSMHDPSGGYQQPLYLSGPGDHGMGLNNSYNSPPTSYSMQQHNNNSQMLLIQQQQAAAAQHQAQQQHQQHQQQAAAQQHAAAAQQAAQQQQQQQMMMAASQHGQTGAPPQPQPPPGAMGQYGRSPQHPQQRGNSPPAAPGQQEPATTSEDSDDSTPHPAMITGLKRPSPEPADPGLSKVQKKPKVQKKKKKRDPNEPQKPVSAYALFFRDTQAAIKGQNPNASFGEVSKIVASMWDALDSEHKNVYKKKTEAAKKEYLKALAAYRASLVSKGAGENEGMYGNYGNYGQSYSGYSPQSTLPSPPMSSAQTPPVQQQQQQSQQMNMNKKPSNMMNSMNQQQQQHQNMMGSPMGGGSVPGHMNMPQHMSPQVNSNGYMQQVNPVQVPVVSHIHMSPPRSEHMVSSSPPVSSAAPVVTSSVQQQQQQQPSVGQPAMRSTNACIRHGCPNAAISNAEWEDEYCSNECVVSHCRDVFSTWVASNQNQTQNYSTVK